MPKDTWKIIDVESVALEASPEPEEPIAVVSLEDVLARLERFETEVIELRAENAALKQERTEMLSVLEEGSNFLVSAAQEITGLTAKIQDQQTLETHLATAQNALVDARSEATRAHQALNAMTGSEVAYG
jgi:chromosome segregation ATPase